MSRVGLRAGGVCAVATLVCGAAVGCGAGAVPHRTRLSAGEEPPLAPLEGPARKRALPVGLKEARSRGQRVSGATAAPRASAIVAPPGGSSGGSKSAGPPVARSPRAPSHSTTEGTGEPAARTRTGATSAPASTTPAPETPSPGSSAASGGGSGGGGGQSAAKQTGGETTAPTEGPAAPVAPAGGRQCVGLAWRACATDCRVWCAGSAARTTCWYRAVASLPFSVGVGLVGAALVGLLALLFQFVIPLPSEVSTFELVKVLTIVVLFAWLFTWCVLLKVKAPGHRLAITGVGLLSVGSVLAIVTLPSHESTSTVAGAVAVLPPGPAKPGAGFEVGLSTHLNGCSPRVGVKIVVNGTKQYWANFTRAGRPPEWERFVIVLPGRYGRMKHGLGIKRTTTPNR